MEQQELPIARERRIELDARGAFGERGHRRGDGVLGQRLVVRIRATAAVADHPRPRRVPPRRTGRAARLATDGSVHAVGEHEREGDSSQTPEHPTDPPCVLRAHSAQWSQAHASQIRPLADARGRLERTKFIRTARCLTRRAF